MFTPNIFSRQGKKVQNLHNSEFHSHFLMGGGGEGNGNSPV